MQQGSGQYVLLLPWLKQTLCQLRGEGEEWCWSCSSQWEVVTELWWGGNGKEGSGFSAVM